MPDLLLGIGTANYFQFMSRFLNWWKQAASNSIGLAGGGSIAGKAAWDAGYFDAATGNLVTPVPDTVTSIGRLLRSTNAAIAGPNISLGGEHFTFTWTGGGRKPESGPGIGWQAVVTGQGAGGVVSIDQANKTGTVVLGSVPGPFNLRFDIGAHGDRNDPPVLSQVKVYQTRYAQNVANGEYWNPDWLDAVRAGNPIRVMDLQHVNSSVVSTFAGIATLDWPFWGQRVANTSAWNGGNNDGYGPKSGLPPELIVDLIVRTGRKVHICLPHQMPAAEAALYFQALLAAGLPPHRLVIETSNEPWNSLFQQYNWYLNTAAPKFTPANANAAARNYGYRAAANLHAALQTFPSRAYFEGVIGTQLPQPFFTLQARIGVETYLAEHPGLAMTDIVDRVEGTCYWGSDARGYRITNIANTNPAVVTILDTIDFSSGQELRLFQLAAPFDGLNDSYQVATVTGAKTFTIPVDATGMGAFVNNANKQFVSRSARWRLMDESESRFNLGHETSKYAYYSRLMKTEYRDGALGIIRNDNSKINTIVTVKLPNQLAELNNWGLDAQGNRLIGFGCYEGGLHDVGDKYVGTDARYNEFTIVNAYSQEAADNYLHIWSLYASLGVKGAKYFDLGPPGDSGSWGALRWFPGDEGNPVWQAFLLFTGTILAAVPKVLILARAA